RPTATSALYTLSLHDALPIYGGTHHVHQPQRSRTTAGCLTHRRKGVCSLTGLRNHDAQRAIRDDGVAIAELRCVLHFHRKASQRSEEHTSELQSRENLVCRLL